MSAPTIEEMAEAVGHARQMLHHAKEHSSDPHHMPEIAKPLSDALRAAEQTLRGMQTPKRVVLHIEEIGDAPAIYSDDGVEVYSVFEPTQGDRIYRFTRDPIPEELLDGDVGFAGDGSAAEARAHRAVNNINGQSHLRAIPTQDAET